MLLTAFRPTPWLAASRRLPALCSLVVLCSTSGLIVGCASTEQAGHTAHPTTALNAANATTSPTDPGQSVSTKAVPAPGLIVPQTLVVDRDSYALREDARQLANQLAQNFQLDPTWTQSILAQARFKDSVAKLIMPAATTTAKNWGIYRSRFIDPIRIKAGVSFWRDHETDLQRAQERWGVPAAIIAGVIGVETIYGRNTGSYRVLDALSTLSLDFPSGRSDRSAFFQKELGHFLKLCNEQNWEPTTVLGSYAGALGLPQFMPSSVRNFAVDFDGDGKVDLRGSPSDAIGSVARYLAEHGWQRDMPAYYEITPPSDTVAQAKLLEPDIVPSFTVAEMQKMGSVLPDEAQNHIGLLALVKLQNGDANPTLIAGTDNFYTITRYNQSSYYALAVIQLGQAVARETAKTP